MRLHCLCLKRNHTHLSLLSFPQFTPLCTETLALPTPLLPHTHPHPLPQTLIFTSAVMHFPIFSWTLEIMPNILDSDPTSLPPWRSWPGRQISSMSHNSDLTGWCLYYFKTCQLRRRQSFLYKKLLSLFSQVQSHTWSTSLGTVVPEGISSRITRPDLQQLISFPKLNPAHLAQGSADQGAVFPFTLPLQFNDILLFFFLISLTHLKDHMSVLIV